MVTIATAIEFLESKNRNRSFTVYFVFNWSVSEMVRMLDGFIVSNGEVM